MTLQILCISNLALAMMTPRNLPVTQKSSDVNLAIVRRVAMSDVSTMSFTGGPCARPLIVGWMFSWPAACISSDTKFQKIPRVTVDSGIK